MSQARTSETGLATESTPTADSLTAEVVGEYLLVNGYLITALEFLVDCRAYGREKEVSELQAYFESAVRFPKSQLLRYEGNDALSSQTLVGEREQKLQLLEHELRCAKEDLKEFREKGVTGGDVRQPNAPAGALGATAKLMKHEGAWREPDLGDLQVLTPLLLSHLLRHGYKVTALTLEEEARAAGTLVGDVDFSEEQGQGLWRCYLESMEGKGKGDPTGMEDSNVHQLKKDLNLARTHVMELESKVRGLEQLLAHSRTFQDPRKAMSDGPTLVDDSQENGTVKVENGLEALTLEVSAPVKRSDSAYHVGEAPVEVDQKEVEEKLMNHLIKVLPRVCPGVPQKLRLELLPLILLILKSTSSRSEQQELLKLLFNLISNPDSTQRQAVVFGFVELSNVLGSEWVVQELLPLCEMHVSNQSGERRMLVADVLGALIPAVDLTNQLPRLLTILTKLSEDRLSDVRTGVCHSLLAIMNSHSFTPASYSPVEDILINLAASPFPEVQEGVMGELLPLFLKWAEGTDLPVISLLPKLLHVLVRLAGHAAGHVVAQVKGPNSMAPSSLTASPPEPRSVQHLVALYLALIPTVQQMALKSRPADLVLAQDLCRILMNTVAQQPTGPSLLSTEALATLRNSPAAGAQELLALLGSGGATGNLANTGASGISLISGGSESKLQDPSDAAATLEVSVSQWLAWRHSDQAPRGEGDTRAWPLMDWSTRTLLPQLVEALMEIPLADLQEDLQEDLGRLVQSSCGMFGPSYVQQICQPAFICASGLLEPWAGERPYRDNLSPPVLQWSQLSAEVKPVCSKLLARNEGAIQRGRARVLPLLLSSVLVSGGPQELMKFLKVLVGPTMGTPLADGQCWLTENQEVIGPALRMAVRHLALQQSLLMLFHECIHHPHDVPRICAVNLGVALAGGLKGSAELLPRVVTPLIHLVEGDSSEDVKLLGISGLTDILVNCQDQQEVVQRVNRLFDELLDDGSHQVQCWVLRAWCKITAVPVVEAGSFVANQMELMLTRLQLLLLAMDARLAKDRIPDQRREVASQILSILQAIAVSQLEDNRIKKHLISALDSLARQRALLDEAQQHLMDDLRETLAPRPLPTVSSPPLSPASSLPVSSRSSSTPGDTPNKVTAIEGGKPRSAAGSTGSSFKRIFRRTLPSGGDTN